MLRSIDDALQQNKDRVCVQASLSLTHYDLSTVVAVVVSNQLKKKLQRPQRATTDYRRWRIPMTAASLHVTLMWRQKAKTWPDSGQTNCPSRRHRTTSRRTTTAADADAVALHCSLMVASKA